MGKTIFTTFGPPLKKSFRRPWSYITFKHRHSFVAFLLRSSGARGFSSRFRQTAKNPRTEKARVFIWWFREAKRQAFHGIGSNAPGLTKCMLLYGDAYARGYLSVWHSMVLINEGFQVRYFRISKPSIILQRVSLALAGVFYVSRKIESIFFQMSILLSLQPKCRMFLLLWRVSRSRLFLLNPKPLVLGKVGLFTCKP